MSKGYKENLIEEDSVNKNIEESKPEETPKNTLVLGVVTECAKLRLRSTPEVKDNNTITELNFAADLLVDLENSTEDFYKVTTSAGVEGYCMKQYVNIEV